VTFNIRRALAGLAIPALLAGQEKDAGSNSTVPESVRKLLQNPRLGVAKLTWKDGRSQEGQVVRVTNQFIAFSTIRKPKVCEIVALSEIAEVQPLKKPGEAGAGSYVAMAVLFGVIFAPFAAADVISNPFKRMSPPKKPLRGLWENRGSRRIPQSSLEFIGDTIQYRSRASRRGRWSVENGKLHLMLDGEIERISLFHFQCGELVLDNSREVFREWSNRSRATAPILGDWHGVNVWLNLKGDGTLVEEKFSVRRGTFENTSSSVRMHWTDSLGPGGPEWTADIKHRRIVVSINGVATKYHYVPPSIFNLDL
jgi:hypothetical protein